MPRRDSGLPLKQALWLRKWHNRWGGGAVGELARQKHISWQGNLAGSGDLVVL